MTPRFAALVIVIAIVASGLAILAGANVPAALLAASVAVAAVAFLLVGVAERTRWPDLTIPRGVNADPEGVREAMAAGPYGRADLIALLDRLERADASGHFSNSPPEEVDRLVALGPVEFREYLERRVSDLERRL